MWINDNNYIFCDLFFWHQNTENNTHKCVPAPKLHTPKLTLRMGSPHRNINESVPFRGLKRGFGAASGITTQCVWVHRALLVRLWGSHACWRFNSLATPLMQTQRVFPQSLWVMQSSYRAGLTGAILPDGWTMVGPHFPKSAATAEANVKSNQAQ